MKSHLTRYIFLIVILTAFGNSISAQKTHTDKTAKQSVKAASKEVDLWLSKVKEVANWYCKNFSKYQQYLNGKQCPLTGKKVRDDCSGLATACLLHYGIYNGTKIYNSGDFRSKNGALGKLLEKKFTPITGEFKQTDYSKFLPGDILAGYMYENGKVQKVHGHVTIYAGNGKFYDWGGWAYKSRVQPISGEEKDGYMHDHIYTIIWRMK